ncbi:pantoate--beta-alanine ligase [Hathewaya limosa]|uniref:Pantothenate synthetase n=1 Tax=Hathewaya limosa TaxID=1536 RepID=A0ABU0JN30_HATLI|nr:pantoate--beta-alanine ligase [Hathewaya limosa]MDQ0478488.1 pantoate--beta-alanine ligase [Hathewaya limosa]
MKTIKNIKDLRIEIDMWKKAGLSIGLVPTMGFLHEGHKSLIQRAVKENDKVVVSIFVNPIQFGPNEDYDKYPRDIEKDSKLCTDAGASLIFNPEVEEMYPDKNPLTFVNVENITNCLCGAKRPGHFQGVCTIVSKLFNIVAPNKAYFGEKDAQQLSVIKQMVKDLNFPIEIIGCPIVREKDGLAKSSRNTYLSIKERQAALILSKSLKKAKIAIANGEKNTIILKNLIIDNLISEPLARIDYVEIVDFNLMCEIDTLNKESLIAIAVYIGKTRLIDNIIIRR